MSCCVRFSGSFQSVTQPAKVIEVGQFPSSSSSSSVDHHSPWFVCRLQLPSGPSSLLSFISSVEWFATVSSMLSNRFGQSCHLTADFRRFFATTSDFLRQFSACCCPLVASVRPNPSSLLPMVVLLHGYLKLYSGLPQRLSCPFQDCLAPAVVVLLRTDLGLNCHPRLQDNPGWEAQI